MFAQSELMLAVTNTNSDGPAIGWMDFFFFFGFFTKNYYCHVLLLLMLFKLIAAVHISGSLSVTLFSDSTYG